MMYSPLMFEEGNERDAIVFYIRGFSEGLLPTILTEYQMRDWSRINGLCRALDNLANLIENGAHYGETAEN